MKFRLTLALALLAATGAHAQSAVTAFANGNAWGDFQIGCSTCGHIPIPLTGSPDQQDGGPGAAGAAVSYTGGFVRTGDFDGYTLAGGASYAAMASFEGALGLPVLKARASTNNEWAYVIADPDVPAGIDIYQASANADTARRYQYLGSTPASYTFSFTLDGSVSGEQASVFGAVSIYDGSDPVFFETGLIASDSSYQVGTGFGTMPQPFAAPLSVTVNVQPGDVFYLRAHLGALANGDYEPGDVFANAYDTLRIASVTGDTGLLLAAPVPEPAPLALLALGLAVIVSRRWRPGPRRAAACSGDSPRGIGRARR